MGTAWERVVKGRLASHALSRLWSGCKRPDLCLWVVKRSFLGFDQANSRMPKTTTLVPLSWHQLWPKKLGLWNPGDIHPLLEKTLSQHLPRCLYFGSTWASPILDNRSDLMKLTEDWQPGVVPVRISPSSLWPSSYSTITTPSCPALQPSRCGCEDLSVRLGSRISLNRHRVVVEVHWRGAQGWRSISWVVATFNQVGGSFNLSMAATRDVWMIPSFWIWDYVLHVEHISCVITNCGQLQWANPSLFSIALLALLEKNITRQLQSLSLDLFFKILLFQVTFLIFFSTAIFSPYFLQVGLLLQYVALFQSGNFN